MIRRRRETPPPRHTLLREEMVLIIALASTDRAARLFAVQAMLAIRAQSLLSLRAEHITLLADRLDVLIVTEKVTSDDGAARSIRGIPFDARRWHELTAETWQPVIDIIRQEQALGPSSCHNAHSLTYREYNALVRDLLLRVAPRLAGQPGVGTHVARRTGAVLHVKEGWSMETVMRLGG